MNSISVRICTIGAFAMQFYCLPAGAQALVPYQAVAAISDSATCPDRQCILKFPAVPTGKRLVVASVSAQLGDASDQLVLEGGDVTYFVPKSHPDLGYLAAPVTVYYDAGTIPTARIFAPNTTQHVSLIVTLVGRLVAP
jgi:hypothetical protein